MYGPADRLIGTCVGLQGHQRKSPLRLPALKLVDAEQAAAPVGCCHRERSMHGHDMRPVPVVYSVVAIHCVAR